MPSRFLKNRDSGFSQAFSAILKRECQVEKADADIRELQRQIQSNCMELTTHTRSHEENEKNCTKNRLYKKEHYEKFALEEFNKLKN